MHVDHTVAELNFYHATKELKKCKDATRAWEESMGIVKPSPPKWRAPHKMPAQLLKAINELKKESKS